MILCFCKLYTNKTPSMKSEHFSQYLKQQTILNYLEYNGSLSMLTMWESWVHSSISTFIKEVMRLIFSRGIFKLGQSLIDIVWSDLDSPIQLGSSWRSSQRHIWSCCRQTSLSLWRTTFMSARWSNVTDMRLGREFQILKLPLDISTICSVVNLDRG